MSGAWSPHCRPAELLEDAAAREHLTSLVAERGLTISALSCHANPLHPDAADRGRRGRGLPRHGAARGRDRRRHRDHVLRLPGRVRALAAAELGHVLVAGRLPGDARVAVGRARASLLGRRRARSRSGTGFASRSSRTLASSSTTPPRCCGSARARARASASTSIPRTCSGRAWIRSPASTRSAMRSSTCMRRTPASRRTSSRSTACSSRSPATARPSGAGSSARSARGIPSSSGATLVDALGAAGYDGALSIEHEDPLLSHADGLELAVTTLRAALGGEVGGSANAG